MLTGLPDQVRHLVTSAPLTRKKLLELELNWDDLPPGKARLASALRVFLLTWDPLETEPPRPGAFATSNEDPYEVVLYIPVWSLAELAAERTIAAVLGEQGGRVVFNAWVNERDPQPGATDLLADADSPDTMFGVPAQIKAIDGRWDAIGLGAITDIVKHAHGAVDLDRSLVELAPVTVSRAGCPACEGERFGFIAHLMEARQLMCAPHSKEADSVRRKRFARAEASNGAGWWAIADASARLSEPHLPNGLLTRLATTGTSEPGDLADRARLVAEAAGYYSGRAYELAAAFGNKNSVLPEWLTNFVLTLGGAGLGAEAVLVAEALSRVNPAREAPYAGDVMVALASAGLADEARATIMRTLARWPDDSWVCLRAGDALELLSDREGALAHFETARQMAVTAKNFQHRRAADDRIRRLTGATEATRPVVIRQPRRTKQSKSRRPGH
jgi:hypothetical protein